MPPPKKKPVIQKKVRPRQQFLPFEPITPHDLDTRYASALKNIVRTYVRAPHLAPYRQDIRHDLRDKIIGELPYYNPNTASPRQFVNFVARKRIIDVMRKIVPKKYLKTPGLREEVLTEFVNRAQDRIKESRRIERMREDILEAAAHLPSESEIAIQLHLDGANFLEIGKAIRERRLGKKRFSLLTKKGYHSTGDTILGRNILELAILGLKVQMREIHGQKKVSQKRSS